MDYFYAFLIFLGIVTLTSSLTGFFGLLIPILYSVFGFILGIESFIMGIGGLLGSLLNIYGAKSYIRTQGAMSGAPWLSIIASYGFLITFLVTVVIRYSNILELNNINYWYLIILAIIAWIVLSFHLRNIRRHSLD